MNRLCRMCLISLIAIGTAIIYAEKQAEAFDVSAIEIPDSVPLTVTAQGLSVADLWAKTEEADRMWIEITGPDGNSVECSPAEGVYNHESGQYEWNGMDVLQWGEDYELSYFVEQNGSISELSKTTLIEKIPLNKPELIWPLADIKFTPERPVPLFWSPVETETPDTSEVTYRLAIAAYNIEEERIEPPLPHRDEAELFSETIVDKETELDNRTVLITVLDEVPYVFSNVKANFVYYWKVEATDSYGNSSSSEIRWFFGNNGMGCASVWFHLVIQDIMRQGVECNSDDITLFKHPDTDTPYNYMAVSPLNKPGEFMIGVANVCAENVFDLVISVNNYLLSENRNLLLYELDAPSIAPVQIKVQGDYNEDARFDFDDVEAAFRSFAGISGEQNGLTLEDVKAVFDLYLKSDEGSI